MKGGSTNNFFNQAEDGVLHTLSNFMGANPEVLTSSNTEGIERVMEMEGKYAFFMESASIDYIMERHCDLARVGRELDAKGYGIGGRLEFCFGFAVALFCEWTLCALLTTV